MKTRTLRALLWVGAQLGAAHSNLVHAESRHDAWLRYAPIGEPAREKYTSLPVAVVNSSTLGTAQKKLIRGVRSMLGRTLRAEKDLSRENAIVLGTFSSIQAGEPAFQARTSVGEEEETRFASWEFRTGKSTRLSTTSRFTAHRNELMRGKRGSVTFFHQVSLKLDLLFVCGPKSKW